MLAFGMKKGELRMFVHYQPSFCAFATTALALCSD